MIYSNNFMPAISIILPAYNAELTIKESIESILNQDFTDFELLIINDGSNDNTQKIIESYKDSRIKLINNEKNYGLIYSLNKGLDNASGKYIARMDADDISMPHRLKRQFDFMEANPEVIVCGSKIRYFGQKKFIPPFKAPKTDYECKQYMIYGSCFAHPTTIIRKSILDNYNIKYDDNFYNCEDYKLWLDLMEYGKFYNLQQILLKYRISAQQITQNYNLKQIKNSQICRRIYLKNVLGIHSIEKEITIETIRTLRYIRKENKYIIPTLYLSLNTYSINIFKEFLFSKDFLYCNIHDICRIAKRFIKGKQHPLI